MSHFLSVRHPVKRELRDPHFGSREPGSAGNAVTSRSGTRRLAARVRPAQPLGARRRLAHKGATQWFARSGRLASVNAQR
jgi:hypothetical protein